MLPPREGLFGINFMLFTQAPWRVFVCHEKTIPRGCPGVDPRGSKWSVHKSVHDTRENLLLPSLFSFILCEPSGVSAVWSSLSCMGYKGGAFSRRSRPQCLRWFPLPGSRCAKELWSLDCIKIRMIDRSTLINITSNFFCSLLLDVIENDVKSIYHRQHCFTTRQEISELQWQHPSIFSLFCSLLSHE